VKCSPRKERIMDNNNFVDELLSASNIKMYREILNKVPDEEDSLFIDNWIKYIHYELETLPKEEPKKEYGIKFEKSKKEEDKVDIAKYEYLPFDDDKQYVFSIDLFYEEKIKEGLPKNSATFLAKEYYKYHLTKIIVKNGRGYIRTNEVNIEVNRKYCMEVK
jgi:hypothetical protein